WGLERGVVGPTCQGAPPLVLQVVHAPGLVREASLVAESVRGGGVGGTALDVLNGRGIPLRTAVNRDEPELGVPWLPISGLPQERGLAVIVQVGVRRRTDSECGGRRPPSLGVLS